MADLQRESNFRLRPFVADQRPFFHQLFSCSPFPGSRPGFSLHSPLRMRRSFSSWQYTIGEDFVHTEIVFTVSKYPEKMLELISNVVIETPDPAAITLIERSRTCDKCQGTSSVSDFLLALALATEYMGQLAAAKLRLRIATISKLVSICQTSQGKTMLELISNVVIKAPDPSAITLTELTDTGGNRSVPVLGPGADVPDSRFAPFAETALFRIFAYTTPSPEGCLRFAREYGLLDLPYHSHEGLEPKSISGDVLLNLKRVEAISTWEKKIDKLRDLIERWDAVQSQNPSALPKSSPVVELYPEALPDFMCDKPGDESGTGRWFWERLIEKDTLAQNRYCVVECLISEVEDKFRPQFVWDRSGTQPLARLQLEPESLWVGLCLQFLLSIMGGTEYGRCRLCERWFEVSAEERRSHKTICSETCRTRLYRNRKRLAYEMSQGGKTPREIARELDTDVKTVRGWIQRKGK